MSADTYGSDLAWARGVGEHIGRVCGLREASAALTDLGMQDAAAIVIRLAFSTPAPKPLMLERAA